MLFEHAHSVYCFIPRSHLKYSTGNELLDHVLRGVNLYVGDIRVGDPTDPN
jgi:hypothetical protein